MAHLIEEPFFTVTQPLAAQKYVFIEYSGFKKVKQSVPQDDGTGTLENLIYVMTQYTKFVREAKMEDESVVTRFIDVLNGTRLSDWNRFMTKYDDTSLYNLEYLEMLWDEFIIEKACKHPRDVMIRYFRDKELCKKPLPTEVRDFYTRFRQVWDHTLLLPEGNETTPSEKSLKEYFFLACPQQHQLEFTTTTNNLDEMEWDQLVVYMEARRRIDVANGVIRRMSTKEKKPREGDAQRKAYRQSTRHEDRRDRARVERHHKRRHEGPKKSGYDNRREKKARTTYRKDGQDCPRHMPCNHTWPECDDNPANANKKQRAANYRGRDRERRDNRDRRDRREHVHHARERDSSSESRRSSSSSDASIRSESPRSAREESDGEEHVNAMMSMQDRIPKKKKVTKKSKTASAVDKAKKVKPGNEKSWPLADDWSEDDTDE